MRKILVASLMAALALSLAGTAQAQITEVSPFTGTALEDFEGFSVGNPGDTFGVFGDSVTHNKLFGSSPFVWPSGGWGLCSNGSAQAIDGNQGFGINSFAQGEFVFSTPVVAFGAYFGVCDPGGMIVRLFDESDTQIGSDQTWTYSRPGDGVLEWHGWTSSVPIARVEWGSTAGPAPAIDSIRISEQAVPTLGEWGLIVLALALACVALIQMSRLRLRTRRS